MSRKQKAAPIDAIGDLDFAKQNDAATAEELDDAATRLREALRELGFSQASDRP